MQAKAPYSIRQLHTRLIPSGAYLLRPYNIDDDIEVPHCLRSMLHLNSFQNREWQPFMELQPLPMPYKSFQNLPEPIYPVTVISCDGRTKPLMFGLNIKQVSIMYASMSSPIRRPDLPAMT